MQNSLKKSAISDPVPLATIVVLSLVSGVDCRVKHENAEAPHRSQNHVSARTGECYSAAELNVSTDHRGAGCDVEIGDVTLAQSAGEHSQQTQAINITCANVCRPYQDLRTGELCVTQTCEREDYLYVDVRLPIGEQIQLLPGDKVKIAAEPDVVAAVDVGAGRISNEYYREFVVAGKVGSCVVPGFVLGSSAYDRGGFKIIVSYRCNFHIPRVPRGAHRPQAISR